DAAHHHHHERVDDVALTELGAYVAELREGDTTHAGHSGTEGERPGVDATSRNAHGRCHFAVLRDGSHVQPERSALQQEVDEAYDHDHEQHHRDAAVRQYEVGQELPAAGQPFGVGDGDVLRAEHATHGLDQHQAQAPRREQRLQR